jgi:hypothetical protein
MRSGKVSAVCGERRGVDGEMVGACVELIRSNISASVFEDRVTVIKLMLSTN